MKKILYLFAIITLVFTSCQPLEDVNEEVDALTANNALVDDIILTLVEEDYTEDVEDGGLGLNFPNFSNSDQAKELLPAFLANKYPALGATYKADGTIDQASSALITYDIFFPKRTEKSLVVYEVTQADYDAQGGNVARFGNFSDFDDIVAFLDTKYPNPADRLLVSLTYEVFNGARTVTAENGFITVNGTWEMATGITDEEYTAMGEPRSQFSSEDEALAKLPIFAKTRFQFEAPEAKDIEGIMYKLFVTDTQDIDDDGRTDDRALYSYLTYVIYDGANWSIYDNVLSESLQFGHDGTKWVPDNTIKLTLTAADVAFISSALITKYPGPADNLGFFGSFDLRASSDNFWSDAMILEAINLLLNNKNPSAEEGQKYSVTYAIFDGQRGFATTNVIKVGSDYELQ